MDSEAIFVIGALAIVAGAVLYLPFFVWFRRRRANVSGGLGRSIHVTRTGLWFYGAMALFLFVGFAVGHFLPDSWFGAQVRTVFGALGYTTAVCIAAAVVERMLVRQGLVFAYRASNAAPEEGSRKTLAERDEHGV